MLKSLEFQRLSKSSTSKISILFLFKVGFGVLLTFILVGLFVLGEPTTLFWLLASTGLFLWSLWAFRQPVYAFSALLFVWITVYSRSTIPIFQVEGPGNRGGIALGDFLWLVLAGAVLLKTLLRGIRLPKTPTVSVYTLLVAPYIILASILPLLGVTFEDWPLSYGLPGIRHLQWASFAFLAFCLARQFGAATVIYLLFTSVLLATVFHTVYSGLQVFASMELIPWEYLILDQLFSERFVETWFYYPRATGLLINPNSYGLLGALVFVIFVASILSGLRLGKRYKILMISGALWAVLVSGSRSAVLGILVALVIMYLSLLGTVGLERGGKLLGRALRFGLFIVFTLTPLVTLAFAALPEVLRERLLRIAGILSQGAEVDPNATGRIEMWFEAIAEYWLNYPFGTLVPPSYALWLAIDSYYVVTLTQGTPIFLFSFLLFLFGAMLLGFSLLNRSSVESKWVGLTLLGFSGVVAGASFTLSPLLQAQVIALFWSLLGLGFAMVKR